MLFKGQVPNLPYLILFFGPVIMEVMLVPDAEFSQGTGWRLVLPCGRAGWKWSAVGHHLIWLEQDVMMYTLGCWSPILPRRWDLWGR